MLWLYLDKDELEVALDLCRRCREIEPLESPPDIKESEWGLTDLGRANASSIGVRVLAILGTVVAIALPLGAAAAGTLGIKIHLANAPLRAWLLLIPSAIVVLLAMLLLLLDYRYGTPRHRIVANWRRYRKKLPAASNFYRLRGWATVAAMAAGLVFLAVVFFPHDDLVFWIGALVLLTVLASLGWLIAYWLRAISEGRRYKADWSPPPTRRSSARRARRRTRA